MGPGKDHGGVTYFRRVDRARHGLRQDAKGLRTLDKIMREIDSGNFKSITLEHFVQAKWLPARLKKMRPRHESALLFDSTKSEADPPAGELRRRGISDDSSNVAYSIDDCAICGARSRPLALTTNADADIQVCVRSGRDSSMLEQQHRMLKTEVQFLHSAPIDF
jgi:hypothetical protein